MLDSVLSARDRFMKPTGLMVPSQCSIMLSLFDASQLIKDRIDFWDDVYGYSMKAMKEEIYDEALIDVVHAGNVVSNQISLKVRSLSSPISSALTSHDAGRRNTNYHRPRPLIQDSLLSHCDETILSACLPRSFRHLLHRRWPTRLCYDWEIWIDRWRGLLHHWSAGDAYALETDYVPPSGTARCR